MLSFSCLKYTSTSSRGESDMNKNSKIRRYCVCLVMLAVLSACAEAELASHTAKQVQPAQKASFPYKVGKPYQIAGVWYTPKEDFGYDETGIASWYGPNFHGKQTASGEIYDQNSLTAAHPTLPMPTIVRVTNLENGRSIKVRINDRGPFAQGRIIDLSMRGAELLGFKNQGTAKVRVQVLEDESRQVAGLPASGSSSAPQVGKVEQNPIQVVRLDPPVVSQPVNDGEMRIQPYPYPSQGAVQPVQEVVEVLPVQPTSIYVQAGAFTNHANATTLAQRLSHIGSVKVHPALVNGTQFYRVRLGPVQEVSEADLILAHLVDNGITSAKVVVD
jgi:rare lipoprotein A